jgi:hypothetical protein
MSMYAYNSRNRGEQPPPPQSQSSREAVPWGCSTFNLPYRVSSSAGPFEKRHFFFSTLKKIQSADGSYASKVGALASRFETGEILLREAHGHLAPMYDEASLTPIWNSTAYQITNPILMNEDGKHIVPDATATALLRQLPTCAFLRFDLTIDPTTVYGECLEARFALKSGVAIPDIVRTNAVAPPMTNVSKLLVVKDLLVAIRNFTGANPIVKTIKPPEAGSTWHIWNVYQRAGQHESMSTTYAASLLSCPNASRNCSLEMSPTLQSNRTSQGANKPFLTQPSAAQSTQLSLNIMKLSPPLSLDPLTTKPNRSHLTLENYSLAAPTPTCLS